MFLYLGNDQYINAYDVSINHIKILDNKLVITAILKYTCETTTYIVEFLNHDDANKQLIYIINSLNSLARQKTEKR